MPDAEHVAAELAKAESMDDFFGKDGIFARLFADTLESMMEEELTDHLGYEPYEAKGYNSGNSRNGYYNKKVRTSEGDTDVRIPRDRNGDYEPKILRRYAGNTNELEEKIIGLYAKGMSTRDIQDTLHELYGVEISAQSISTITDKIWSLVEAWQSRPLDAIYPFVFLDALHLKLRREGKIENTAVYVVLGVAMDGHRDVLGHWVGDGSEGANFWLSVVSDLEARGVKDVFIASVDGLAGFKEAIQSIFPRTQVQRCIVHQIRHSLRYVAWKDRKAFVADLKMIYQAPTLEQATANLHLLAEKWGGQYAIAVKSWEKNWDDLTTFFDYPADIRRIIYTTNTVEAYHRQLRRVTKTKSSFPSPEAARKLLYLATVDIMRKWTMPIRNWPQVLNQLVIRFEDRLEY
ncbi:MAG: IS256 family transposase [Chloroflexota bacterium]